MEKVKRLSCLIPNIMSLMLFSCSFKHRRCSYGTSGRRYIYVMIFSCPSSSRPTLVTDCFDILAFTDSKSSNQISQYRPNFTISTIFHNFNQISQFNKFHNFDQIAQFQQNFTIVKISKLSTM